MKRELQNDLLIQNMGITVFELKSEGRTCIIPLVKGCEMIGPEGDSQGCEMVGPEGD